MWGVHSFRNAVADYLLVQMEGYLENSNVDRSRPFSRNDRDGNYKRKIFSKPRN